MRKLWLSVFLSLAVVLAGCSGGDAAQETQTETQEQPTGVQVSEPFYSEEYGTQMVDLYNFDAEDKRLYVETLCFDEEGRELPTDDSEELTLPTESRWGWIPVCPDDTASFSVRFRELGVE